MLKRTSSMNLRAALLLGAFLFAASAAQASVRTETLASAIEQAGIDARDVRITDVLGVVILRGRVATQVDIARMSEIARSLGYRRVANLVRVSVVPNDRAIERAAERALAITPALEGCQFSIRSRGGRLKVGGIVQHESQRDTAETVLKGIEGVRSLELNLRRGKGNS